MAWVDIADLRGTQGPAGSFQKGIIPNGSNINTWNTPDKEGSWVVNNTSSAATITGLPESAAGQLMNYPGIGSQIYTAYGSNPKIWFRGINNVAAGTWSPWEDISSRATIKNPALMPSGTDLNNWYLETTAGVWNINSTTLAQEMANLPVVAAGKLINYPNGISFQIYMTYGAAPGVWFRGVTNVVTKAWSAWSNLLGGQTTATEVALAHQVRADSAHKRAGYRQGTGGKGVIMLRFDDYPQDFKAKVLPALRANDLPSYFAVTKRWIEELQPTPWAEVQDWAINDGVQMWSHSMTHSAASSTAQLNMEIIESADYFESMMPRIVIDGWVMPGTGVTDGPYGGYNGKVDADFYATEAGRMIMSRYGIVNAARAGFYQPQGGHPVGQSHQTMDNWTLADFQGHVNAVAAGGYALSIMLHPGNLDGTGFMSTATMTQCLEWLAAERAAGRILVLTGTASAVLDPGTTYRQNLLPGLFGGSLRGWTGWTLNGSGDPERAAAGALTCALDTNPVAWARGGARELAVGLTASASSVVRLTITGTGIAVSKDYTVPAGASLVRKPFMIPYTGGGILTVGIERVSGGTVSIQRADALSI